MQGQLTQSRQYLKMFWKEKNHSRKFPVNSLKRIIDGKSASEVSIPQFSSQAW